MNVEFFSDEIRERERRRRRKDLLWNVASIVFHVVLFGAIILATPVKSLVFDREKKKANPASELSADRIEQIADSLSQARINELLRQLEALQAVLHNMDLMKEELQKDYDSFAEQSSADLRSSLGKMIDEVEKAQGDALAEQATMIGKVAKILEEEKLDLVDEERSKWLHKASDELITEGGDRVADAQARAGNALDRMQVQAEFGGYMKTAEASGKVRDAQIEAAAMQNQAQKEASEIAYKMGDMRGRVNDLTNHEKWLAEQRDRLAKAEQSKGNSKGDVERNQRTAEDARRRIADLEHKVDERRAQVKNLEDIRSQMATEEQVRKFERASKAQEDIRSRIGVLRGVLENDEPELRKLVRANRAENELVERNAAQMKMVDAYELARTIENAITESYKDIKATKTAIERKMSFETAQRLTDVAKAVRLDPDREAIESKPRTKEALDAQKAAQAEVVRETDNIVETVVAMMDEAMEIVQPDDPNAEASSNRLRAIRWLDEKDFERRAGEDERRKRLEQMAEMADFQVAIDAAAAENEEERAKDLVKVMEEAAEVKRNTELADAMQKTRDDDMTALAGRLEPLSVRMPELVPGNVASFSGGDAKGAVPAKWMYVQDWYVIGPFPNPNRVNIRRKFPPESVVDLDATYVGKDGRTIRWEFMQTKNSTPKETWRVDGKAELVPYNAEEYGIWYAYAEVFSDVACERWIAVGSDDRSDIWVNDVPVWGSSNKLKSWRIDEGYRRIRLEKGRNRILARVENGWHALGWSVCISLEEGELGEGK